MIELRISIFAYELLREEDRHDEVVDVLKTRAHSVGTDVNLEYHWVQIADEDYLMAKLKHPSAFKYFTARRV